jgi:hypothetical protein
MQALVRSNPSLGGLAVRTILCLITHASPACFADAEVVHQVPYGAGSKVLDRMYATGLAVGNCHFEAIPKGVTPTRPGDEGRDGRVQIHAFWRHTRNAMKEEIHSFGGCPKLRILE